MNAWLVVPVYGNAKLYRPEATLPDAEAPEAADTRAAIRRANRFRDVFMSTSMAIMMIDGIALSISATYPVAVSLPTGLILTFAWFVSSEIW
jgi:hypothetical protein